MKLLVTRSAVVSILLASAIGIVVPWIGPAAASTATNGKIVFRQWLNDAHTEGEIFTINPDGTGSFQVTHTAKGASTEPDPSPNGRWIDYMEIRHGDLGSGRLFKIRPDGSHRTSLSDTCTGDCIGDGFPDWSSTDLIAFQRNLSADVKHPVGFSAIFVMHANGTHARQVTLRSESPSTGNPFYDESPAWSPKGRRIAFDRGRNNEKNLHAIFTVHLNGSALRRITPWRLDASQPQYSPDGQWIAFRSNENSDTSGNIWLVHPDGSELHNLTKTPAGTGKWQSCGFSPDGQFLVSAENQVTNGDVGNADVYVIPVTGGTPVDVTNTPDQWESAPDWGTGQA
jgi:TolB protein